MRPGKLGPIKPKPDPISVSFYDPGTGLFSGRTFRGPRKAVENNTPAGMVALAGLYDPLSQRVNTETGEVIDYRPDPPDKDHEWNVERRRWVLKPEVRAARSEKRHAQKRIEELEAKQYRPVRELLLDPSNAEARDRLEAIDTEIRELRNATLKAELI